MRVITFKADESLLKKLESVAKQRDTTRSAVIRSAVKEYVGRELRAAESPSAYELVEDIAGSVEGPEDLSTARRHLEGYGK
ncbi:MAG: ribbon-helix-helix protein, CopG family [Planctomycetes bacterium]|nr:ribbon-helix-helix protein, CopG family [Planctomycetota bacterium]